MSALPGEYTELRTLGQGASGRVMLARHEPSGVLVAVKHLAPRLHADPSFRELFRAEAVTLHTLRHPNIVGLFEYIEDVDESVLVMELVEGVALTRVLESGAASPEAALSILEGSLLGLEAAHQAGIVHRDYKPDNVLVDSAGTSRLLDFGVAVGAGQAMWRAGTPVYMAPEAWQVGAVTPSVDVYAATAVFFECLTGHPPFPGPDLEALRVQHLSAPIPVGEVPDAVRHIVRTGLAKSPGERFPTSAVFLSALEEAAIAGYGADWRERGRRALAVAVGALAGLWPLAALAAAGGPAGQAVEIGTAQVGSGGAGAGPGAGAGGSGAAGGGGAGGGGGSGAGGGAGGGGGGGAGAGSGGGRNLAAAVAVAVFVLLAGVGGGYAMSLTPPFHSGGTASPVAIGSPTPEAGAASVGGTATPTPSVAAVESPTPEETPSPTASPTASPTPSPSATSTSSSSTSTSRSTSSSRSTSTSSSTPTAPPPPPPLQVTSATLCLHANASAACQSSYTKGAPTCGQLPAGGVSCMVHAVFMFNPGNAGGTLTWHFSAIVYGQIGSSAAQCPNPTITLASGSYNNNGGVYTISPGQTQLDLGDQQAILGNITPRDSLSTGNYSTATLVVDVKGQPSVSPATAPMFSADAPPGSVC